jgi:hypothetical protein
MILHSKAATMDNDGFVRPSIWFAGVNSVCTEPAFELLFVCCRVLSGYGVTCWTPSRPSHDVCICVPRAAGALQGKLCISICIATVM